MKSGLKKAMTVLIILSLMMSTITGALAQSSDYHGHWAEPKIEKLLANGIISQNNGIIRPNDKCSRAELVMMLHNIFGYSQNANEKFRDVPTNAWYADVLMKAKGEGIIAGYNNHFYPTAFISRQDAITMIGRAFKLSSQSGSYTKFKDSGSVASYAQSSFNALIDANILVGSNGLVRPKSEITRAEIFSIISGLADKVYNKAGTYENEKYGGNIIINKPGITLKNITVGGDLYLAPGIGQGDVYLNNVQVQGRTIVSGGGENSIHVINSLLNTIIVNRQGGSVRVVAEGATVVSQVVLQSSATIEEADLTNNSTGFGNVTIERTGTNQINTNFSGRFNSIAVNGLAQVIVHSGTIDDLNVAETAQDTIVQILNAVVNQVRVNASAQIQADPGASISNMDVNASIDLRISSGAIIANLSVNSSGAGTSIEGSGIIQTIGVNAPGVTINSNPAVQGSISTMNGDSNSNSSDSSSPSNPPSEPTSFTYIVNYYRYDGRARNWDMWIWPEGGSGSEYEFSTTSPDGFAQATLTLPSRQMNIIIRPGSWSSQETTRTIRIPAGQSSVQVWIVQDVPQVYYARNEVDISPKVNGAMMDSFSEIIVSTTHPLNAGDESSFKLHDKITDQEIPVFASTIVGNPNRVRLTIQDPSLVDVRGYYEVSSNRFSAFPVTMRRVLDNPQFFYSGNDLGLTYTPTSSTFKVWAPTAKKVSLALYNDQGTYNESGFVLNHTGGSEFAMTRESTGVWSITRTGNLSGQYYMYKVEFASGIINYAVDPYARAVAANGQRTAIIDLDATDPVLWDPNSKPATIVNSTDSILYELHIRDFSIDADAPFVNKGKYAAFTETGLVDHNGNSIGIDHIAELGITTIHLLPPYDAGSVNELKVDDPNYTGRKYNWGYDPVNYNVPEGIYSSNPSDPKARITEFKEMIQALHDKGIRVVMDVVYNHTYETGITPNSRFDPIVPGYFYRISDDNRYSNGSGVNNDIATERPMVRKYIVDSVKYWAEEYNMDGFRFDLLGLFDLNTARQITSVIKNEVDPTIVIYGEPWTAATTLMDPSETPVLDDNRAQQGQEFSFFNDRFRNNVKGETEGTTRGFATGETGREDEMVAGISGDINDVSLNPQEQVNYATAHDNYNLWDKILISTSLRTGNSDRHAASFDDPYTNIVDEADPFASIPVKQSILSNSIILLAQGIPFFPAGDEFLRSKYGVADSYSAPDSINQISWSNLGKFSDVNEYYKGIIKLRREHPAFRMNMRQDVIDHLQFFIQEGNIVGYQLKNNANGDLWNNIVVIHNANPSPVEVTLPANNTWNVVVNGNQAGTSVIDTFTGNTVTVDAISTMVLYDTAMSYTPEATTIELTPSAIGIDVGNTRVMKAVVKDQYGAILYGQTIQWSSDNQSIATVNNGKITGESNGQTTIRATCGTASASVVVNVEALVPQSLSLSGADEVAEGYSTGIRVTVRDQFNQEIFNPQVSWESLNPEIATVNNKGLVTGITPGNTTIRAISGGQTATLAIEVIEYHQRYLEVQYDRPDGNYVGVNGDWDLWTWDTGSRDGEYEFTETLDGRRVAFIPLGQTTDHMHFIVRAGGWGGTDREPVDGVTNGERVATINMSETYTKVIIRSGDSSPSGMITYPEAISEVSGSSIVFRYRDDDLFRNNDMDLLAGSVQVKVNDQVYDMAYDQTTEMLTYTLPITEGKYLYTFLVTKDGNTNEILDVRNDNIESGKSVLEYYVADINITPTVSPTSIHYNQNAVLKLDITTSEPDVVGSIYADLSQLGGGTQVSIDPTLNALTIGVEQSIDPGQKSIPIHVIDKYGNTNITEASITIVERTTSSALDFDWDEARIYFAITDRFNDGDISNNDPNGLGDYNPNHLGYFHGGDFQGLINKLDYLQELGINTLWITPIIDNVDQLQDGIHYGYHGYWAKNFTMIDEHLGDLEKFKELINAAHDRGIKIMLDVVINHVGYGMGPLDPDHPEIPGYPDDNDRLRYTGLLREQNLTDGVLGGYNYGLPDFMTENAEVRAQVIKLQTDWIERARTARGDTIDYFRLDTVNNLDLTTLSDFRNALAQINPDFKMVGEAFDATLGNSAYLRGTGRLDSVLDFGFNDLAQDFVQNRNINAVEQALIQRNNALDNTTIMASFLNSHDETNFLVNVNGNKGMLKVAASLMMTAKGQPVIYYGEEYGNAGRQMNLSDPLNPILSENRADMPWETGDSNLQAHYKKLLNIRAKYSKVFAKGTRQQLYSLENDSACDVFTRSYNGETILVALNVTENDQYLFLNDVPFAPGTVFLDEYGGEQFAVDNQRRLVLHVPSMTDGGTLIMSIQPGELAIIDASLNQGQVALTFNQNPGVLPNETSIRIIGDTTSYAAALVSQSDLTAIFNIPDFSSLPGGSYRIETSTGWAVVGGAIRINHVVGPYFDRITLDGNINESDWSLTIDDAQADNRWGSSGNSIDDVYTAWDDQNLYISIKGDGDRGWNHGMYVLVDANVGTNGATRFTTNPPYSWADKRFTTSSDFTVDFAFGGYGDRTGYEAWTFTSDSEINTSVSTSVAAIYGPDMENYMEVSIPWSIIFHANGGTVPMDATINLALMFNGNEPSDVAPDISTTPAGMEMNPVLVDRYVSIDVDTDHDGSPDMNMPPKSFASIMVDGAINETSWGTPVLQDAEGDNRYGVGGNSIKNVYTAWDSSNFYMAVQADGDTGWGQGLYLLMDAKNSLEGRTIFDVGEGETRFEWGDKRFTTTKSADVVFAGYGNESGYAAWTYTGNTTGTSIASSISASYGAGNLNYIEISIPWSLIYHAFGGVMPSNAEISFALMFNENNPGDVAPDMSASNFTSDNWALSYTVDNWQTVTVDANGDGQPDKLW